MKKLLLLFAILFSLTVKSQTNIYHHFPDSDATWSEIMWSFAPGTFQYSYTLSGDTVIGASQYHKLFIPFLWRSDTSGIWIGPPAQGYNGSIREDTVGRKVYYVRKNDTTEHLLFDFNIQVGDTLDKFSPVSMCAQTMETQIVISIDSILIGNNYRKKWNIDDGSYTVEGIGGDYGLLGRVCVTGGWSYLNCFSQNGQTLYPDTITQCAILDGIKIITEKNNATYVYPNPFISSTLLQLSSEFENATVKFYDALGLLVRVERISNQKTFVFNRNELRNGIYFMQLINDHGQMIIEKIVVE